MKASVVLAALAVVLSLTACGSDSPENAEALSSPSLAPSPAASPTSGDDPTVFNDGDYTIGQEMPAGSYVAEPLAGGCFWARFDATGETIDNDFTQATRVEVEIQPTDYSFHSEGCGPWTQLYAIDPNSPEGDSTTCSVYVVAMSPAERAELVGPFLSWERRKHRVRTEPSEKLVKRFAKDIADACADHVGEEDEEEYTVGILASVVYDVSKKAYSK